MTVVGKNPLSPGRSARDGLLLVLVPAVVAAGVTYAVWAGRKAREYLATVSIKFFCDPETGEPITEPR
jgi:hypothetical protein